MDLRPYLAPGQRRYRQIQSSHHKKSSQLQPKSNQTLKEKEKNPQILQQPKPRPYSHNSEYKINILTKQYLNKQKGPQITCTNFILYDELNKFFLGKKEDHQREVASLTKIMTTVVALELIEKYELDKSLLVKVSKNSAALNGTSAKLPEGIFVKLYDLVYGAMLPSGNDAAYLLAEVFGLLLFYENIKPEEKQYNDIESIDLSFYENTVAFVNKFIKQMNRKAKQLKMTKTNFANPHGLGNVLNVSSAKDMMILSRYASRNEEFRNIMSTREYRCDLYEQNMQAIGFRFWRNTNKLINQGWEGIKTGQTPSAGCCLASLKNGIFIVVLNSSSIENRFLDTIELYDWYQTKGMVSLKRTNQLLNSTSFKQFPLQ